VNHDKIPQALKQLDRWVVWGVDTGKPKMPFNPTSMTPAKAGDPSTWDCFETAWGRVVNGQAQGVGFEFHNDGYYGIDLDHVLDERGSLSPEATEIVKLLNSYTEISPSGTGLHIIVKAGGIKLEANRKGFIEIYNQGRYFTMTGNIYEGAGI